MMPGRYPALTAGLAGFVTTAIAILVLHPVA